MEVVQASLDFQHGSANKLMKDIKNGRNDVDLDNNMSNSINMPPASLIAKKSKRKVPKVLESEPLIETEPAAF